MRKTLTLSVVALIIGAVMPAALAGGWAMTAFDSLPDEFEAGHSYTLEYTVLQHGRTPVDVGLSEVTFIDVEGRALTFEAQRLDAPGRYTVEVTLPEGGTWSWSVSQGYFASHDMGTVVVATEPVGATTGSGLAPAAGTDGLGLLRILLPVAAVVAAAYTVGQVARTRRESTIPTDLG
jgi:hypothetical protein